MKQLLFLFLFVTGLAWTTGDVVAQEAIADSSATVQVINLDDFLDQLGDTIQFTWDGVNYVIPLNDTKDLTGWVVDIVNQYKASNPKGVLGFILFLLSAITGGVGLNRLTQVMKVWATVKDFFSKKKVPGNFVALGSLVLALLVLLPFGAFTVTGWFGLTGGIFMIATLVYNNRTREPKS